MLKNINLEVAKKVKILFIGSSSILSKYSQPTNIRFIASQRPPKILITGQFYFNAPILFIHYNIIFLMFFLK